jgi:uncharacterized protein YjaZ
MRIKPVLREKLQLTGFDQFAPYLYGDAIAKLQNFKPVNMPYSAGYACGYYLIQYYLRNDLRGHNNACCSNTGRGRRVLG